MLPDRAIGRTHPGGLGVFEAIPGKQKQTGIELITIEHTHIALHLFVPCAFLDLAPDQVANSLVVLDRRASEDVALTKTDQPVHSRPTQKSRVCVILAPTPWLPDALVRLIPVLGYIVSEADQCSLHITVEMPSMKCKLSRGINDLPVDIKLKLISRRISNADRPRVPISAQVFQFTLHGRLITVKRIENSQLGLCLRGCTQQPIEEVFGFIPII